MTPREKALDVARRELRRLAQQDTPDPKSVGRWSQVRRLLARKKEKKP